MSKKLKLTKIALETKDGKSVELSIDEDKELHDQLHELFGSKTTYIPSAPIIVERDIWRQMRPYYYDVTCNSSANSQKIGGEVIQCSISGNSGMTVLYCGDSL